MSYSAPFMDFAKENLAKREQHVIKEICQAFVNDETLPGTIDPSAAVQYCIRLSVIRQLGHDLKSESRKAPVDPIHPRELTFDAKSD